MLTAAVIAGAILIQRVEGKIPGTDMGRRSSVREHDNRETSVKVWKQFIQPMLNKADAALRVAEQEWKRDQRDRGRGR